MKTFLLVCMVLTLSLSVVGCSDESRPTETENDSPAVVWTYPGDGQIGGLESSPMDQTSYFPQQAPMSAGLQVKFNKIMDTESVEQAIVLTEAGAADGNRVRWQLSSQGGDLFTLFPLDPFSIGKEYSLEIGISAMDTDGDHPTEPYSISFLPEPYFQVEHTFPDSGATGISTFQSVLVGFNSKIDKRAIEEAFTISPKAHGETQILSFIGGGATWERIFYFLPRGGFLSDTEYTVTIGTGAADIYGNHLLEACSFSFSMDT